VHLRSLPMTASAPLRPGTHESAAIRAAEDARLFAACRTLGKPISQLLESVAAAWIFARRSWYRTGFARDACEGRESHSCADPGPED
jgi:hypothetical protein